MSPYLFCLFKRSMILLVLTRQCNAFYTQLNTQNPTTASMAHSPNYSIAQTDPILSQVLNESLLRIHDGGATSEQLDNTQCRANLRTFESEADDIAWLSGLEITSGGETFQQQQSSYVSLACWNGPRVNVPHMLVTCRKIVDGAQARDPSFHVRVNFCPRLFANWDSVLQDGSFEPPNSRAAFQERERRTTQYEEYFTDDILRWAKGVSFNSVGVLPCSIPYDCTGPVHLDLAVASAQQASDILRQATDILVDWRERSSRQGSIRAMQNYAFDVKTRPAIKEMQSEEIMLVMPDGSQNLGEQVAMLNAGPPDLADRSSAMATAALENFEVDHMKEMGEKDIGQL